MNKTFRVPDEVWEFLVGLREWTKEELEKGFADPETFYKEKLKPHLQMLRERNPELPMVYIDRAGGWLTFRLGDSAA